MDIELESENTMGSLDPLAWRLADGDPGAPRELVERHHAELYCYARALMRDGPAAEDAVQDAFERAFAALGKYPKERIRPSVCAPGCTASPSTWCATSGAIVAGRCP